MKRELAMADEIREFVNTHKAMMAAFVIRFEQLYDKERERADCNLSQVDYDNLVRDAMQWRAIFTAPDIVPRSRLDAVEVELATAEQTLKQVQKYGHAEITRLEEENKLFREALAWIANIRESEQPSSSDISKAQGAARLALTGGKI